MGLAVCCSFGKLEWDLRKSDVCRVSQVQSREVENASDAGFVAGEGSGFSSSEQIDVFSARVKIHYSSSPTTNLNF